MFSVIPLELFSQNPGQTEQSKSTQPFQILDQWNISDSANTSLISDCVFTGRDYWCISYVSDSFYIFNINKELVNSFNLNSQLITGPAGLAWDGSYIYTSSVSINNKTYRIDSSTLSVKNFFFTPDVFYGGMTFDANANSGQGGFWVLPNFQNAPIYLLDTNGNYIDSISRNILPLTIYNIEIDTSTFNRSVSDFISI